MLIYLYFSNKIAGYYIQMILIILCAKIRDKDLEAKLHKLVSTFMIHGLCGNLWQESPHTVAGKCLKYFPKKFVSTITIDKGGYIVYRRCNTICLL